jgi:Protein of unknown function DUF262
MALQEPKLYTLNEVLHDRLFRVPPYQRGYSWTRKEREDLFQDLRNVRELRRDEHFMATLVFRNTGKHVTIGGADRCFAMLPFGISRTCFGSRARLIFSESEGIPGSSRI